MVKYVLHYFNGRGRGESVRQLLVLAGQTFEDKRIEFSEWAKVKDKFVFGQVPVLEEDGKPLAQEYAIDRYLARKYGLAGKTEWEQAQVDALADQFKDFFAEVREYFRVIIRGFEGDADKLREESWYPAVQKHLPLFVKAIEETGSGYLVGNFVTWVDLLLAEWINTFGEKHPEIFEQFPVLKAHRDLVHNIPRIKQWREKRPQTEF